MTTTRKTTEPIAQHFGRAIGGPDARPVVLRGFGDDAAKLTPINFLVEHQVPEKSLGWTIGMSGSKKSFIAIQRAAALSIGDDYLGCRTITGGVPTLYVAGEGAATLPARVAAMRHHLFGGDRLRNFHRLDVMPNILGERGKRNDLRGMVELRTAIERTGARYVVLDTLTTALYGRSENSTSTVSDFVGRLNELIYQTEATIELVHHESDKAGPALGGRGSSAWKAAMDYALKVSPETYREMGRLAVDKMKSGADDWAIGIDYEVVDIPGMAADNFGTLPTSLILHAAEIERPMTEDQYLELRIAESLPRTSDDLAEYLGYEFHMAERTFRDWIGRVVADMARRGLIHRDSERAVWLPAGESAPVPRLSPDEVTREAILALVPASTSELADAVADELDVTVDTARKRVARVAAAMETIGLIERAHQHAPWRARAARNTVPHVPSVPSGPAGGAP